METFIPRYLPRKPTKKGLFSITLAVVLTGIVIRVFLLDSFIVKGNSMAPTVVAGDYVFVNKLAYIKTAPQRGDIVVGEFRDLDGILAIKRIVGLPREWIFIEEGSIYVAEGKNGERTMVGKVDSEEYIKSAEGFSYRLDPFEYFLMGDNGLSSVDSRDLGPIDLYSIKGKLIWAISLKSGKFYRY